MCPSARVAKTRSERADPHPRTRGNTHAPRVACVSAGIPTLPWTRASVAASNPHALVEAAEDPCLENPHAVVEPGGPAGRGRSTGRWKNPHALVRCVRPFGGRASVAASNPHALVEAEENPCLENPHALVEPGGPAGRAGSTACCENAHALVRNVRSFGGGVGREPYCGQEYDGRRPGQQVAAEV